MTLHMKSTALLPATLVALMALIFGCYTPVVPPDDPSTPYPLAILKKHLSDEEARQLYDLAERNDPDAGYRAAQILMQDGINETTASFVLLYLTNAAEKNHAGAQYQLGMIDYNLKGFRTAFNWIEKAAEQGFTEAEYSLGYMYYEGEGTTQDYRAAVEWFLRAAEKGHVHAQGKLGIAHFFGHGVDIDKRFAFVWLTLAAAAEPEYAEFRDILAEEELSQADVLWGQREAREWTQRQQSQQTSLADR